MEKNTHTYGLFLALVKEREREIRGRWYIA